MSMLPADAHRVLERTDNVIDASDVRCAKCGGNGHLAKDCPWDNVRQQAHLADRWICLVCLSNTPYRHRPECPNWSRA